MSDTAMVLSAPCPHPTPLAHLLLLLSTVDIFKLGQNFTQCFRKFIALDLNMMAPF